MNHVRYCLIVALPADVAAGAVQAGKGHGMAGGNDQQRQAAPAVADQALPMIGVSGETPSHDG